MAFYLNDIYTIVLIFSSIVFTILIFIDKNRILLSLEYFLNQKYSVIYHRNDSFLYKLCVSINTLIILSILTSFYILYIQNGVMSLYVFMRILCVLFAFFLFKLMINYFLGNLFEALYHSKKYYYGYSTSLFVLSVVFFPFILFISYYNDGLMIERVSLYIFYLFLFLYFILKIILLNRLKLFKISFIFYNILYLCAVEVLPYVGLRELLELIH